MLTARRRAVKASSAGNTLCNARPKQQLGPEWPESYGSFQGDKAEELDKKTQAKKAKQICRSTASVTAPWCCGVHLPGIPYGSVWAHLTNSTLS